MTTNINIEAKDLIENFLTDMPSPSKQDWGVLIDANPEFAREIVDAAILYSSFDDTNIDQDTVFDQTAYDATISSVLNHLYQTPSHSILEADKKIEAIKGAKIKSTLVEIGMGPYPVLLNGILAGRILAPVSILSLLSNFLEVPRLTLQQVFQLKFEQSVVPSFKSVDGKPEVQTRTKSWEEAVLSLKLADDETLRLLKFSDQDLKK